MDSKAEVAFACDVAPQIEDLGGEIRHVAYNAVNHVLHVEIVLHNYSSDSRREVLQALTTWQLGLHDPVDVSPIILAPSDLLPA